MRISPEARELAQEIVGLFAEVDEHERIARALAVILWSHRQRPTDDKEQSAPTDDVLCQVFEALAYKYGGTVPGQYDEPEDKACCRAMHIAAHALGKPYSPVALL